MSQQVVVEKSLNFQGTAENTANVKGNPSFSKMVFCDHFTQVAIDTTNDYTSTLGGTSDAVAVTGGGAHTLTLTTGTGDNEVSFLASALIFDVTNNPVIEAKVTITDVSGTSLFFGFASANTETTPASTIDYADGTLAASATTTDAVGFVCDADKVTSTLYAASIATGGAVAAASTGIIWTDGQEKVLRIAVDSSLDASFWVDGVLTNTVQLAVTDVPLCFIVNYGTRAADGSNTVVVDYIKAWSD